MNVPEIAAAGALSLVEAKLRRLTAERDYWRAEAERLKEANERLVGKLKERGASPG